MLGITSRDYSIIVVLLIIWVIVWFLYNNLIRKRYKNPLLEDPLTKCSIELPSWMKCYIKNV